MNPTLIDPTFLPVIIVAGIIGGFINVVAGGGSLITMPTLILLGLPSATANGTNRIALLFQNSTAITHFKKHGYFEPKEAIKLALPASFGALLGSYLANIIDTTTFNTILAVVMILVLILTLTRPERYFTTTQEHATKKHPLIGIVLFFFIGIYGGFLQIGTGFLIILGLSILTGANLKKINSQKVIIILIYVLFSLILFVYNNNIDIIAGLLLAIGMSIGGYLGSHFTLQVDERYIKAIITIAVIALSFKLLGIY